MEKSFQIHQHHFNVKYSSAMKKEEKLWHLD